MYAVGLAEERGSQSRRCVFNLVLLVQVYAGCSVDVVEPQAGNTQLATTAVRGRRGYL